MTNSGAKNGRGLTAFGEQPMNLGLSRRADETQSKGDKPIGQNSKKKSNKKGRPRRAKLTPEQKAQKAAKEHKKKMMQRSVAIANRQNLEGKAALQEQEPAQIVPTSQMAKPSISDIERSVEALLPEVAARTRADYGRTTVSESDLSELATRLEAGRLEVVRTSEFDAAVQLYLGFDFGTTSTKLVFDLPYDSRFPRLAVPAVPALQAESRPFLWQTSLWMTRKGGYSLLPTKDAQCLAGFKVELMKALTSARSQGQNYQPSEPELTASAYFALMLRQALGWLKVSHPQVWEAGSVEFHVNYGFPASTVDHPRAVAGYKRCARAALALVESGGAVDRDAVAHQLRQANLASGEDEDWDIFPEITAAVAGFASSVQRRDGLYMIVDIGGMTVDCSTFNLYRGGKSHDRCPIFSADVRNLGVEPLKVWLARGKSEEDYQKVIWSSLTALVRHTFTKRNPTSDRWGIELETFVTGGGAGSKPHEKALDRVSKETERADWCKTPLRFLPLPAENIEAPGLVDDDAQRLLVAIGLARPIDDIPEWVSESQVPDFELGPRSRWEDSYVGPEQM